MRYFRENPDLTEIAPCDMAKIEARILANASTVKTHEKHGSSAAMCAGGNLQKCAKDRQTSREMSMARFQGENH